MEKPNMNGYIFQKLEYLNNLLKKYKSQKKSMLKIEKIFRNLKRLQAHEKKSNKK